MTQSNPTIDLIATRENPIYAKRRPQMEINWRGYIGGSQYVKSRLTRFPNESELSYTGGTNWNSETTIGRIEYTPQVNHLGAIVDTISDLVFMNGPIRTGGDNISMLNIDGRDNDISYIMGKANDYITIFGYAWLRVDAPKLVGEMTLAEKQENDIRPFVYAVSPLNVVDWSMGKTKINWVLEQDVESFDDDPTQPAQQIIVRRLWEQGKCTIIRYMPKSDKRKKQEYTIEEIELSVNEVPWVLVGEVPEEAYNFDSFENINRHILNLESSNAQVFFDSAFPREFIGEKTFERLYNTALSQTTINSTGNNLSPAVYNEGQALRSAFKMAVGTKYPTILGNGDSPYTPNMPSGLNQIREEINEMVETLQRLSGIALRKRSNVAESAIAKVFDSLTVRAIIKDRAKMLETAERLAIYLCSKYDPSFPVWEVTYQSDLVVQDAQNSIAE